MKKMQLFAAVSIFIALVATSVNAVDGMHQILSKNVHVWDGPSDGVTRKISVLVENNLIKKLRASPVDANADATVIDGGGRFLIPGLIEMHTHLMFRYGVTVMRNDFDAQPSPKIELKAMDSDGVPVFQYRL